MLAAIVIPVAGRARETARQNRCAANLRGLHSAAVLWSNDNNGRLPDARFWGYNEGASNSARAYQLNNYLGLRSQKGAGWEGKASPMKCDAAAASNESSQEWGHTYSINTYATSTLDGVPRSASSGYPARMSWIPHPARMAFFMDGARSPASGSYQTNVSGAYVNPSHATPLDYPHDESLNVVFIDGHVERVERAVMLAEHANSSSSFWRYDR